MSGGALMHWAVGWAAWHSWMKFINTVAVDPTDQCSLKTGIWGLIRKMYQFENEAQAFPDWQVFFTQDFLFFFNSYKCILGTAS